jgi:hypothetical protein
MEPPNTSTAAAIGKLYARSRTLAKETMAAAAKPMSSQSAGSST